LPMKGSEKAGGKVDQGGIFLTRRRIDQLHFQKEKKRSERIKRERQKAAVEEMEKKKLRILPKA